MVHDSQEVHVVVERGHGSRVHFSTTGLGAPPGEIEHLQDLNATMKAQLDF